jgi:MerR family transcriptional regulator/heat shock protein HspR
MTSRSEGQQPPRVESTRGVYGITTAAELVGIDPQSLRLYERRGLLEPARTSGGTRRYSADDLERLHRIRQLLDAGVNLAGIALVLELEQDNVRLRDQMEPPRP